MKCPYCQYSESKVIDSRPTDEDEKIRRRRECMRCGKRFTTYEIVETTPLMVVKKDGSIEPFNREKLLNGLLRACEKRPVSLKALEQIVDQIEQKLKNALEGEGKLPKNRRACSRTAATGGPGGVCPLCFGLSGVPGHRLLLAGTQKDAAGAAVTLNQIA